jgi:hypothetical protein
LRCGACVPHALPLGRRGRLHHKKKCNPRLCESAKAHDLGTEGHEGKVGFESCLPSAASRRSAPGRNRRRSSRRLSIPCLASSRHPGAPRRARGGQPPGSIDPRIRRRSIAGGWHVASRHHRINNTLEGDPKPSWATGRLDVRKPIVGRKTHSDG